MQVNFLPYGQPGDLGVRSKGRISLKTTKLSSKICVPNFVCVLTNTLQNISKGIIIVSPGSCPRGGTWGAGCQKLELL